MDPLTGLGIMSLGQSLIGGMMGNSAQSSANKSNLRVASYQNEFNEHMQDKQNAWNLEQWNRQNEYTSALNQRKRIEQAGLNPFFATGEVAAGSASTQNLQSAGIAPAAGAHMMPVDALANSVKNTDFVGTLNNIRMANSQVQKNEADAKLAEANAAAISGYKQVESSSKTLQNQASAKLAETQSALNQTQNDLLVRFGSAQNVAQIEQLASQRLLNDSAKIKNEKQAYQAVAEAVKSYASAKKMNVESNQISKMTDVLVQSLKLKNTAQNLQNDILNVDKENKEIYGRSDAYLGNQSLQQNVRHTRLKGDYQKKENQAYWWKFGAQSAGTILKAIP